MSTYLVNARLILSDRVVNGGLLIADGILRKICLEGMKVPAHDRQIDLEGAFVSPGFVDLHVHGGGGYDFLDGTTEAFLGAAQAHMRHGTTTLLPTATACSMEELEQAFSALRTVKRSGKPLPDMPGMHLEGPFLSPLQAGAIDPAYLLEPTEENVDQILSMGEKEIARMTFASELPGAISLCKALRARGILASVGHSDAEYSSVLEAVEAGSSLVTHLYSAMSTLRRRNASRFLGVLESAYLLDELDVEIIADGCHLPPELLRLIIKEKPMEKICLITDAMRGAEMPEGSVTRLGSLQNGRDAIIKDGVAYMPDFSCFAGSVCTTDRCVRTMVKKVGVSLVDAISMMSSNPCRVLGISDHKGTIAEGMDADLCVFDDDIQIQQVWIAGEKVYSAT